MALMRDSHFPLAKSLKYKSRKKSSDSILCIYYRHDFTHNFITDMILCIYYRYDFTHILQIWFYAYITDMI